MKKNKATRILCLALSAVMMSTYLTGCAGNSGSESKSETSSVSDAENSSASEAENEEGEGEEINIEDLKFEDEPPVTALNLAQGNINVAEGEDFTAQLDFTVENGTIDGTVSADTITLKDAFEGLKIDSVSNDGTTLTVNISGTPKLGEMYNVGTIELDGKYLGVEDAVSKSVVITQLQPVEMTEGGTFHPFFDAVVENDDSYDVTILLKPIGADFTDSFGKDSVTLGADFKDAEITSLEKSDNEYELVLKAPKSDSTDSFSYMGRIELAAGSLIDGNGKENAEPVYVSRDYSAETLGRDLEDWNDITTGADWVNVSWDDYYKVYDAELFNNILSYGQTAISVGTAAYQILGICGVVPTEKSRHEEVMKQLAIINHKLDVITEMLENQKDMLNDIHADLYDQYLAQFDVTFDRMVSNCNEITNALNANENLSEIEALIAKLEEGGDEDITKEEIQQFYKELSAIARDSKSDDGANPASYFASEVSTDFKTICGYFKTGPTNPILQRRALHSLTDNFSTTSFAEDMAYEMEIQTQLNRALTLMKLVQGFNSQGENQRRLNDCYFPKLNDGTDANGNPMCYIIGKHVKVAPTEVIIKDKKLIGDWNLRNNWSDADANRFVERMNGRTAEAELTKAGFKDFKYPSTYGSKTGANDYDSYGLALTFTTSTGNGWKGGAGVPIYLSNGADFFKNSSAQKYKKMVPDGEDGSARIWEQLNQSGQKVKKVTQFWFLHSHMIMWNDKSFKNSDLLEMIQVEYSKSNRPVLPLYPTVTLAVTD